MKFLIVGDVQAKKENLHLVRRLLKDVEFQPHNVIWLGDLLDRRGHIEADVLNLFYDYFRTSEREHHIIVGNHDLIGVHSDETALKPLKALENVFIIDQFERLPFTYKTSILMMPYCRNPEKFLATISSIQDAEKPIALICHQGVREFTLGSGYAENEAIPLEALKAFNLVIAGHYHTPMDKGNVVYLGSPFSHSFSESNERKRLAVFDTETLELEFISTHFPQHFTLEFDLTKGERVEIRYYGEDKTLLGPTRAIITGTEAQLKDFQKISGAFPGVKFIYRPKGGPSVTLQENMSNADKWIKWSKEVKKLDQATIDLGLELLK